MTTATFNGTCKTCGHTIHVHTESYRRGCDGVIVSEKGTEFAVGEWSGFGIVNNFGPIAVHFCATKGRMAKIRLSEVRGTVVPEKVCNAKCMGSTRHVCECSCGGKNHGASYSS